MIVSIHVMYASDTYNKYGASSHKELRKLHSHKERRQCKKAQKAKDEQLFIETNEQVISHWQNRVEKCDNARDLRILEFELMTQLDDREGDMRTYINKLMAKQRLELIHAKGYDGGGFVDYLTPPSLW